PRSSSHPIRAASTELDRQLLAIPASTYVPALTGRQPNRAGKIHCPFHDDHSPSLQLYDHGWYCFGRCRTGGSVYDFGALLYGLDTKGHQFLALRQRLAEELDITPAADRAGARTAGSRVACSRSSAVAHAPRRTAL
ncbi:MAG: CHC2 zinc finger domain-containing protein, partial [Solirubrobacteraceae bacterium]